MQRLTAEVPNDQTASPEFLRRLSRFLVTVRDVLESLFVPPVWIEVPVFQNGWVNYAPTTHTTAGYYKDFAGRVWLKGFLKDGTANTVAFTLPEGYRPGKRTSFVGITESGGASREGHIIVDPNGNVELYDSDASPAQYSLNGITFTEGQ